MSAKISTEDLMKGNKLIAEFMGWKFNAYPELRHDNITKPNQDSWYYASYDKHEFNEHITNSIKYHSSWDWLMPVCKKLESLPEHENFNKKNYAKWVENSECLGDALWKCDINHVWLAVTQFITWYNQQK